MDKIKSLSVWKYAANFRALGVGVSLCDDWFIRWFGVFLYKTPFTR